MHHTEQCKLIKYSNNFKERQFHNQAFNNQTIYRKQFFLIKTTFYAASCNCMKYIVLTTTTIFYVQRFINLGKLSILQGKLISICLQSREESKIQKEYFN